MRRVFQGLLGILVVILFADKAIAGEAAIAAQLAAECDGLLQLAVQKPYGWAWPARDAATDQPLPKGSTMVSFEPLGTPSAGLVLYWAGQELKRDNYIEAAKQTARGVLAAQQSNGRVPGRALFGTTSTARDPAGALMPRASTCASLGLLLALADGNEEERLRQGARRAALWLTKQQAPSGAWAVMMGPQDASEAASRLIRLDGSDYRNCTYAVLYAGDVLQDALLRRAAEKAAEQLLKLRIADQSRTAKGLWRTVYDLDGAPSARLPEFERSVDVVACRHAMQTLLGVHVAQGSEPSLAALQTAANTLASLRSQDGVWRRLYPLRGVEIQLDKTLAAPAENPFERSKPVGEDLATSNAFDLPPLLSSIDQLKTLGRSNYQSALSANYNYRRILAQTVAGLCDNPMTLDLPDDGERAKAFLAENTDLWRTLDGPPSGNLSQRVKRIELLLLRLKLERLAVR